MRADRLGQRLGRRWETLGVRGEIWGGRQERMTRGDKKGVIAVLLKD